MTQAGNTTRTLKPTEVAVSFNAPGPGPQYADFVGLDELAQKAPQPSLNSPDIDECAPLINAGPDLAECILPAPEIPEEVWTKLNEAAKDPIGWHDAVKVSLEEFKSERAAQFPEEIPPTNLWSLRWRINQLEERVDELTDRIALFNVRSSFKI